MKATKEQLIKARDEWFKKMQSVFDGTYNDNRPFVLNGVLAKGKVILIQNQKNGLMNVLKMSITISQKRF